ncbi:MAG: DsbE family thiol:disulfide interchange protein [Rhodobacteraceae bacterium]|jgi:cytochrome c biogenesis protein CcmG, thiol:disulfide interchange protein DsbE|nr:DsbE family thiol:disulfide interchange protein [Paracoccaceae bacterium]
MNRLLLLLPPMLFAGLALAFWFGMQRDNPNELPSTFLGAQAPQVGTEALPPVPGLQDADLRGGTVTVVNFWASWCPPCRAEHPVLMQMAADGVRVAGVNIKDQPDTATAYLAEEGNPFFGMVFDPRGRMAIDWGVTAPPETFIIAGDGTVLLRFQGPLVGTDYETRFLPALKAALGGS